MNRFIVHLIVPLTGLLIRIHLIDWPHLANRASTNKPRKETHGNPGWTWKVSGIGCPRPTLARWAENDGRGCPSRRRQGTWSLPPAKRGDGGCQDDSGILVNGSASKVAGLDSLDLLK